MSISNCTKSLLLTLCIIVFARIFFFPLIKRTASQKNASSVIKTFADFENSLCHRRIFRPRKEDLWSNCSQNGIVTVEEGGRLGNYMWEYASVWGIARQTGLKPYVPSCIRSKLDQIFSTLSVPTFAEIAHCPVNLSSFVKSLETWRFLNESVSLPRYIVNFKSVLVLGQDINKEFTFKKELVDKSQWILRRAANRRTNLVFVGVHIRRTDYILQIINKLKAVPASLDFFDKAMAKFEARYSENGVVFVVTSDDLFWCKKAFRGRRNVYIVAKNPPGLDLAILASCNHSIFDYGTYGAWGALLAGGETIYYNVPRHFTGNMGPLLDNWYSV